MAEPRDQHYVLGAPPLLTLPLIVWEYGTQTLRPGVVHGRARTPHIAVHLITHGQVLLQQEGRTTRLHTGEVMVVKPNSRHSFAAWQSRPARLQFVGVKGLIAEHLVCALADRVEPPRPDLVRRQMAAIAAVCRQMPADYAGRLSVLAYHLLLELYVAQQRSRRAARGHPAVAAAMHHIQSSLGKPLSVADLAAAARVSPSHLYTLFRRQLGIGPMEAATNMKMDVARRLLAGTREPVKSIAGKLGFSDPLYFSAAFRRHTGRYPTDYRRAKSALLPEVP